MVAGRGKGWLALLTIAALSAALFAVAYLSIERTDAGARVASVSSESGLQPRVAISFASFLLLPAILLLAFGRGELFELRRGWIWPLAFYACVTALVLAFLPANRDFFKGFDRDLLSHDFVLWSAFMALRVAPVDFFTKRVVQREVSSLAGPVAGQAGQFAAWGAAHVFEFFWLVPLWGEWGSLAFLAATGLASGFVYAKGGSTAAFVLGHWLCNVTIAVAVSV